MRPSLRHRSTPASLRGAVGVLVAVAGLACTAVSPLRSTAARQFDCPPHRLVIEREGLLGAEPLDRQAIRAELREQRREGDDELETVAFRVEGCGHQDRLICHRRGPGRPFRCGVMIR